MVLLYERCVIAVPAAVASHFQHQYRSRMLFCQLGHFLIDEEALVLVIGLDGSLHNADLFGCRARHAEIAGGHTRQFLKYVRIRQIAGIEDAVAGRDHGWIATGSFGHAVAPANYLLRRFSVAPIV